MYWLAVDVIVLEEYCVPDVVTGAFDQACLVEYQARVAEAQQWPAEFTQALPFVMLFVVLGIGLMLGRGR